MICSLVKENWLDLKIEHYEHDLYFLDVQNLLWLMVNISFPLEKGRE